MSAQKPASSGIQTFADGQAYIPSSRRADGSTRKEIKVRPGYKPPEDVERYKSRNVENSRPHGTASVPGADDGSQEKEEHENKSKNAKRREAARKKKEAEAGDSTDHVETEIAGLSVQDKKSQFNQNPDSVADEQIADNDSERQKKIRNQLKKLKAVRELKSKKLAGEKLAADQLIKVSKEQEIVRDLAKLKYEGPEIEGVV